MKELLVDATIENIEMVTDFVNAELELLGFSFKAQMQIDVAIDELFGNIAKYAYGSVTGQAAVRVESFNEPKSVVITFIDEGKPFNPLEAPTPDTTLSAAERKIGGLGIFLVKKTMDAVEYKFENGKNMLSITKCVE